jgi:ATP-dependent DNA ligase
MSATECAGISTRVWAAQEEGIVIKRMDSPWVLNDRSGSWLKVKPEYVKARA